MDDSSTNRQIAALKAIVQTVIRELYWSKGADRQVYFTDAVEDADPVAMAVANELTEEEIAKAFADYGAGDDLKAAVAEYLTPEQLERSRIRALSEDTAEAAIDEAGRSGAGAEKRFRMAARQYVEAMREDVLERGGTLAGASCERTLAEAGAFPNPWRSRVRKELKAMEKRLRGNASAEPSPEAP